MVLMTIEGEKHLWCHDIWVAYSTASMHTTNLEASLFDAKKICEPVKIGDNKLVYVTKVGLGKLQMEYLKNSREQIDFVLENIQYNPDFWVNLFCLTAMMSKGSHISNVVEKNDLCLVFDKEIQKKNSYVCGIVLAVKLDDNCCFATIGKGSKQDINNLQRILCMHPK